MSQKEKVGRQAGTSACHAEEILVVRREILLGDDAWQGLRTTGLEQCMATIRTNGQYLPRDLMEVDSAYKQIIPYLIYRHENRYFLMQRHAKASEKRLAGKLSLGIGGHIRWEDTGSNDIFAWAEREFHEEVCYGGGLEIAPLGILNDDSNEVGQVHLGLVLLLEGDSDDITVKSELAGGHLATLQECQAQVHLMESWSQLVLTALEARE